LYLPGKLRPYVYIESQDGVLAPGALKPSNLSLELELRRWRFAGLLLLLLLLRPRLLVCCGLWWLLLLLLRLLRLGRLGRQRPLITGHALLRVRLARSGPFRPRLGRLRDGASSGIGPPVFHVTSGEAVVVEAAVRVGV
jgi:hypothetical protein